MSDEVFGPADERDAEPIQVDRLLFSVPELDRLVPQGRDAVVAYVGQVLRDKYPDVLARHVADLMTDRGVQAAVAPAVVEDDVAGCIMFAYRCAEKDPKTRIPNAMKMLVNMRVGKYRAVEAPPPGGGASEGDPQ